jgi:hypothetical protein
MNGKTNNSTASKVAGDPAMDPNRPRFTDDRTASKETSQPQVTPKTSGIDQHAKPAAHETAQEEVHQVMPRHQARKLASKGKPKDKPATAKPTKSCGA